MEFLILSCLLPIWVSQQYVNFFDRVILTDLLNPLYRGLMGTFRNSEYPDEMQHKAAFHLGLHCL